MGWEIADDDWDDALGAVDVDAMVAARRNGPPAGSNQPPHQQPPPQSHQPPQQWHQPPQQWHPNQSWQQRQPANHQWGGAPQHPAGNNNNAAGFSGHTGYKGGFSGHDGRGNARGAPNRPRSNYSGHPEVDRALARGGPHLPPDRNQRTVNDMFAKNGRIRADGRMVHDMYLAEVKTPAESKSEWDLYKILRTIPADEAYRPLSESKCPLVSSK